MNKKILGIAVVFMALAMLAIPVFASPTKGQKVAVTLCFNKGVKTDIVERYTNGVLHKQCTQTWNNVELIITDGPTLYGTAVAERIEVRVQQKDGAKLIIRDYYVFTFGDGGFEGNGLVMLDGFVYVDGKGTWESSLAHGLFHGTGTFEGQTLNVGHTWGGGAWTGYWLKR